MQCWWVWCKLRVPSVGVGGIEDHDGSHASSSFIVSIVVKETTKPVQKILASGLNGMERCKLWW